MKKVEKSVEKATKIEEEVRSIGERPNVVDLYWTLNLSRRTRASTGTCCRTPLSSLPLSSPVKVVWPRATLCKEVWRESRKLMDSSSSFCFPLSVPVKKLTEDKTRAFPLFPHAASIGLLCGPPGSGDFSFHHNAKWQKMDFGPNSASYSGGEVNSSISSSSSSCLSVCSEKRPDF